jgi:hypothetical protein
MCEKSMIITKRDDDFYLIPTTKDCPYIECILKGKEKTLVLMSKEKFSRFIMLPKLNDKGQRIQSGYQVLEDGEKVNVYKEDRTLVETFYEYYITDKKDIKTFLEQVVGELSKEITKVLS